MSNNKEKKVMSKNYLRTGLAGLSLAVLANMAAPVAAETVSFKADLTASSEVPANDSKGSGSTTANYDPASKKLNWTVTFSGLSGPATAAHFHGPAEPGKNAGPAVTIAGTSSPMAGSATLTDAQAADLLAGKWYVNVHTAANKDGEIRGQVVKSK
jgi:CHRD domain